MKKVRANRRFRVGDIVRVAEHVKGRKARKQSHTHSKKHIIVRILGYGNYTLQPLGKTSSDTRDENADDIRPCKEVFTEEEIATAKQQAEDTNDTLTEYIVERVLEEQGVIKEGTKQYLVKYQGYHEPEWQPAEVLKDCQALEDFKAAKKKKPTTSKANKTKKAKTGAVQQQTAWTVTADVLQVEDPSLVNFACREAGVNPGEVLLNFNGVPCETFSIAGRTGKGRDIEGSTHGCNYRRNDKFRTPCCPKRARCRYGDKARLHDDIVKRVKTSIEHDAAAGRQYEFIIENPDDELKYREYMQPGEWSIPMYQKPFHCCAFEYAIKCKKPMRVFTSMGTYEPVGTTGNGLCNKGACGMIVEGGHVGKLARDPKLGPRGPGATRAKNSLPEMWLEEVLTHAMQRAEAAGRKADIVVDICAGWQSLKPVCEKLGLRYVALDIAGNRNLKQQKPRKDGGKDRRNQKCRCRQRCAPCGSDTPHGSHGFACEKVYLEYRYPKDGSDRYMPKPKTA